MGTELLAHGQQKLGRRDDSMRPGEPADLRPEGAEGSEIDETEEAEEESFGQLEWHLNWQGQKDAA